MNPQTSSEGRFPLRHCLWCKSVITIIPTHCKSVYAKLNYCSRSCIASAQHHKGLTKADVLVKTNQATECEHCSKPLVRRADEHLQAWNTRRFCNKSCAAAGTTRPRVQPKAAPQSEMDKLGCVRIPKGSDEFLRLQRMYQDRDAHTTRITTNIEKMRRV